MAGRHLSESTVESPISTHIAGSARVRQLVLVFEGGRERLLRITVDDRGLILGRDPRGIGATRLDDAEVSRSHTRVEQDATGNFWAIDCGSRNGTNVDGKRALPRARLEHGSVLRIGKSLLVFVDTSVASNARLEPEGGGLLGSSIPMQLVRGEIALYAHASTPVLILGESGTGKELAAARLHAESGRRGRFVAVNCAAIPTPLADTELFGHAAGAFTGAVERTQGVFGAADEGTLFLDEVGELDPSVQAKLLRVIATGEVRSVGRADARTVSVRVLAATHRNLEDGESARFRGDLYARLSACVLRMPPLRERRDDVLRIASAFLAREFPGRTLGVSTAEALLLFAWPLNVRQLENVLRSAALRASDDITLSDLPRDVGGVLKGRASPSRPPPGEGGTPAPPIELVAPRDATPNAAQLQAVLRHFGGNISLVASYFSRDRKQIYRWGTRLGVELKPEEDAKKP